MSSGSILRRPGFLLVLGLCAIGGAVTLLGRLVGTSAEPTRVRLANVAGSEACPSFSPDGRHLAYSGRGGAAPSGEAGTFHIWVRALPNGAPQQLTEGPGSDICPVWSPDGDRLAFLRLLDDGAQYLVIPSGAPAARGAERKIAVTEAPDADGAERPALSWMRDGKSLAVVWTEAGQPPAIFELALETGAARRITHPPAGSAGDSNPAVSPEGRSLAFVRGTREEAADIWLCDRNGGGLRQLTFDASPIRGMAWTADGREIIYASNRFRGTWRLFRTPAVGGSPRELAVGSKQANDPAIAPAGHRLAYTETPSTAAIWLAALPAGDSLHTRPILRSAGREAFPSWSPDGKQIAFVSDQSGADEIWISDAEGGHRFQVTSMKGPALNRPRWSPDGRRLLFTTRGVPLSVYTAPPTARMARPQPLPLAFGAEVSGLTWAHDGKSVYAESRGRIYKLAHDQEPRQLTRQFGASQPVESPDARYVYYWFRGSIWRVSAGGGPEEQVVELGQWASSIQPVARGVYYWSWGRRRRGEIWFYDFAAQKSSQVLQLNDGEASGDATFDVSPDGRYLLYPKIDRTQTDLVLVENFR